MLLGLFGRRLIDLESLRSFGSKNIPERKDVNIVVIDNDPVPMVDALRLMGFNITVLEDIEHIELVKGYDIVICDIKDVGVKLSPKFQGAFVIKEISKKFPQKFIIHFSGSRHKAEFNEFFRFADISINKGADASDWSELLDKGIKVLHDPVERWERTRRFLIENQVNPKIVNKLESGYIRAIQKKNPRIFEKTLSTSKLPTGEFVSFTMNTLSGFVSSLISSMVTGVV